eukprot:CAMPEP_0170471492 /NCGR_PEP_ID=MMETSP0123-20130129/13697_1 /TAXON_ID=182087 /ORGANISM="Favella ehrenbergii, Strain Fehren 1" /LENGTH=52 /DNA_ID=CAMNT_0010739165 /DNA_START=200 /DNA_END=358 /DNA_ORIENTATION=-
MPQPPPQPPLMPIPIMPPSSVISFTPRSVPAIGMIIPTALLAALPMSAKNSV